MNFKEGQGLKSLDASVPTEGMYPATFHFRIIVDVHAEVEAALRMIFSSYRVTAPLCLSRSSSGGRYRAYGVSVELDSRDDMNALDAAVKRVPGVRLLL